MNKQRKIKTPWTNEEVLFLKENSNKISRKEISKILNHPVSSIQAKQNSLGIKLNKKEYNIGDKIYRLTIINKYTILDKYNIHRTVVDCICECKTVVKCIKLTDIVHKKQQSCGCLKKEAMQKYYFPKTHGQTNTRLYKIYRGMKNRCRIKQKTWKRYWGRGITVCEEWKNNFETFYNWSMNNGYQDNLQIDRINNDGNYEPSNCRWVTNKENSNNTCNSRKVLAFNETKTVSQWLDDPRCVVKDTTLLYRLNAEWQSERAITQPTKYQKSNIF